jgi:hypothetical protein
MIEQFPAKKIKQLRKRARKAAKLPARVPSGWSKSKVDPMSVLAVFKPLCIKDGFILRAYQFCEGDNGNGFVWAMPVEADFPEPEECPRLEGVFLAPPKPWAALDDMMDAIDGDGSAWSYMCASILARELAEFGAMWHGCDWETHAILGANPWKPADKSKGKDAEDDLHESVISPATEWKWSEPEPAEWGPQVRQENEVTTVTFLTYSQLGIVAIYRYIDTYNVGAYRFQSERQEVASGGGGFVF